VDLAPRTPAAPIQRPAHPGSQPELIAHGGGPTRQAQQPGRCHAGITGNLHIQMEGQIMRSSAGKSNRKWQALMATSVVSLCGFAAPAQAGDREHGRYPNYGNFDYGVCRGTNPKCYNDWGVQERKQNRVLVYSRTAGPRHANLGPALPAGLNPPLTSAHVVQNALIRLLSAEGIQVDWTEDVTRMTNLGNYKAVIFASPTRDTLWNHAGGAAGSTHLDAARTALRQYMRAGGGFAGIHNAFGTEYNWTYYEGLLGNANYYNHGANQDGEVVIVNDDDVSTKGLPKRWGFRDEWYNFIPFPTNVNFLAIVDESTLASGTGNSHPGHGKFHPVSWCQYYDGGKVWVTTMGHDRGAFEENSTFPGAEWFQKHIVAGIKSVMGLEPFCTPNKRGHGHGDKD
jgi:hypothetical protein